FWASRMRARRYSLAEAYPSWAIWASTNAFISSGTEIFMVVIRYPPFERIVPSLADFAKRGGNRDAVSIDSNPLRRLRGKLIASRFPSRVPVSVPEIFFDVERKRTWTWARGPELLRILLPLTRESLMKR